MTSSKGTLYAMGAYTLWGLLPVYWKLMEPVPAHEILAHRMVWSLPFVVMLLALRGELGNLLAAVNQRRILIAFFTSALLLSLNWYLYIWAINSGHIVDASLGYFINPLLTVVLGVVFLRERPRLLQWSSIALAVCGVMYLTFAYGAFPWIGLGLAGTFGIYGLLRKTAALGSLKGLTLETTFMFLPALIFLAARQLDGSAAFGHAGLRINLALATTGAATAIPLILFAAAARQTTLTTMGLLQYIAPTLQFLIGVVIYFESVTTTRLIGFSFIWVALLIFSAEGFVRARRKGRAPGQPPKPEQIPI